MAIDLERLRRALPDRVVDRLDPYLEAADIVTEMRDPRVLRSLGPSATRGMLLKRGKQGVPTRIQASHHAHFDWTYEQCSSKSVSMRECVEQKKSNAAIFKIQKNSTQ